MSEISEPNRPRRADADRNVAAILDAAVVVLGRQPSAGMAEIAREAGTSRQTVYAHFGSRDALVARLLDRATDRVVAAIEAADLDSGPAPEALIRFLEIAWRVFDEQPFMLHLAQPPASHRQEMDRHTPILGPLRRLIERGRQEGDFDATLPVDWLLAVTIGLGHVAGEQVRAGVLTSGQASAVLRRTVPKLVAAGG